MKWKNTYELLSEFLQHASYDVASQDINKTSIPSLLIIYILCEINGIPPWNVLLDWFAIIPTIVVFKELFKW